MRYALSLVVLGLGLVGCGAASSSAKPSPTSISGQNHVHSIAILPSNPNELLLGSHYRLYKSSDGGKTWTGMTRQMMISMALDTAHPSTLYAVSAQQGPLKSTDGGAIWHRVSAIPKGKVTGVVVDPATGVVLAWGTDIERSADAGIHWATVLKGKSVANIAVGSNGTAYAATALGLYATHDDGLHWSQVMAAGNQPMIQVAASGPVAYVVTPVSLLKTADGGKTWKTLKKAPVGVEFLGVAPADPNEVIVEVSGSGFYASHDGGATWQHANTGIHDQNFNASTIRVAPSSPGVVYTGAWGLHFYVSHDGGLHWTRVSTLIR